MPLLTDEVAEQLREEFKALEAPVRIAVFSQALADPASEQVKRMVEELGALEPRLKIETANYVLDKERVEALGIQRIPALAVMGETEDYGIRLYGLPSGYEFGTFIDAILDVSRGQSQLSADTKAALQALESPVHIQVFSTPT
jgi:alkyl hydroperoxide reductase subunit AhpF